MTASKIAQKVGKKCLWKLARMGAFAALTPLTGGLGAFPLIAEVFDGALDVVDVVGTAGGMVGDVLGVVPGDLGKAAADLGQSLDDLSDEMKDAVADGEVSFEEILGLNAGGMDVVADFEDLMNEVDELKKTSVASGKLTKTTTPSPEAQEAVLSVAGQLIDPKEAKTDGVESMVFSALRQTQVLTAFSAVSGLVGHAGTWYGLHALNSRISQMERQVEKQNRELVSTMQGELERGFRDLGAEIHNGFQAVHAKLDRLNRKLNQIHGVSNLKRLLTDVADAPSMEAFVNSISRGDIIECEENLLHFVDEFLEDHEETEMNWQYGLFQVGYVIKAYELEFAWLVAKGTERSVGILPTRLEEGARRLGNLIGRFIVEISRRQRNFPKESADSLLFMATSLSNDYARLFAPEERKTLAAERDKGGIFEEHKIVQTHPRRTSAEAFLAIGDISMAQSDAGAAESAFLIALAFDPFYDAAWVRFEGRLCSFEHLKVSGHGGHESPASCGEQSSDVGLRAAFHSIKKHAVDLEMSEHPLALLPTDSDRQESHLQGLGLLVDIFSFSEIRQPSRPANDTSTLESLLPLAAELLSSSMKLIQNHDLAPLLLMESLLEIVPASCSSSLVASTGMLDVFEATTEAAKYISGESALRLLVTITNECVGMDASSLPEETYSNLVSSLVDVIKTHREDGAGLNYALELLSTAAQEHDSWEPFGPGSVVSFKMAFRACEFKSEASSCEFLATRICQVVGNFTHEGKTWAIHELGESFRPYCEGRSSGSAITECCQALDQVDQRVAALSTGGKKRLNYEQDATQCNQHLSTNCVERNGRKRYAGDMRLLDSVWEPSGKGTMEWNGGSIYQGHWKSNTMHGKGTLRIGTVDVPDASDACEGAYYAFNTTYRGDFKNGLFDGYGLLVFSDGKTFAGTFEGGICTSNEYPVPGLSFMFCEKGKIVGDGPSSYYGMVSKWLLPHTTMNTGGAQRGTNETTKKGSILFQ